MVNRSRDATPFILEAVRATARARSRVVKYSVSDMDKLESGAMEIHAFYPMDVIIQSMENLFLSVEDKGNENG